jgi:hypothetical protein
MSAPWIYPPAGLEHSQKHFYKFQVIHSVKKLFILTVQRSKATKVERENETCSVTTGNSKLLCNPFSANIAKKIYAELCSRRYNIHILYNLYSWYFPHIMYAFLNNRKFALFINEKWNWSAPNGTDKNTLYVQKETRYFATNYLIFIYTNEQPFIKFN